MDTRVLLAVFVATKDIKQYDQLLYDYSSGSSGATAATKLSKEYVIPDFTL